MEEKRDSAGVEPDRRSAGVLPILSSPHVFVKDSPRNTALRVQLPQHTTKALKNSLKSAQQAVTLLLECPLQYIAIWLHSSQSKSAALHPSLREAVKIHLQRKEPGDLIESLSTHSEKTQVTTREEQAATKEPSHCSHSTELYFMRRHSRLRRRQGPIMAATILAYSAASAHSFVPAARKMAAGRNFHRLKMSMALDSRQLRFYGGGLDTLDPPFSFSADELPDRISHSPASNEHQNNGYGPAINLTEDEGDLFELLTQVTDEREITSTLRVAGGWVRDKLLSTPAFRHSQKGERLTSKFQKPQASMGRQGTKIVQEEEHQPVDIDIALDDMLGREFADHLNDYLQGHGRETVSVGVVLKNPEKSKHLETATMKVGSFWIDFVNLRAEEYTQDSRIPDLMRIGTPAEDAFRRDLTINALFYNINTGHVEDWTGRGFDDLKRGIVATPLPPLTTLLDDPLRALRSIRFAARLRFTMDDELVKAATDIRVRNALAQKVSRERVGGEVDLMLRSPDPVGAMRLLMNLNLVDTVFPLQRCLPNHQLDTQFIFSKGLDLLSTTHDHLSDCKVKPPIWCQKKRCQSSATNGVEEVALVENEEARRLLWYASFLKPFMDYSRVVDQGSKKSRQQGKKSNRSVIFSLLVDELKRPVRDAEAVGRIMQAADDMTSLINSGCDLSAMSVLLSGIEVKYDKEGETFSCSMNSQPVSSVQEEDPVWEHAMELRLLTSRVLQRVGPLWRASLILSLSEQLASLDHETDYYIEGDVVSHQIAKVVHVVALKFTKLTHWSF